MGNRPQTLYGLADSPVALAAWMLDHDAYSHEDIASAFSGEPVGNLTRDEVLDNITLTWVTNTGVSSGRLYWENTLDFFDAKGVTVPAAVSVFPARARTRRRGSWAEQAYPNLIYFNELDRGNHFAAWQEPEASTVRGAGGVQVVALILRKGAPMSETTNTDTATVVLVHGAFADASKWNSVIARLLAEGVLVTALRTRCAGIAADSAYIAAVLEQIEGPVVAVGHSYGGAVITNAATEAKNVVGLVYVAAFAPEEGETLGAAEAESKDSVLNSALVPRQYPTANGGSATEFYIDPAKARDAFAGDLSDEEAALIGATQRPVAEFAFSGLLGAAGVDVTGRHGPSSPPATGPPGRT